MNSNLSIWREFLSLCNIPHPSGHLDKIREHVVSAAKEAGYEVVCDATGNVLVTIPASEGREADRGTVLQAHLDMVPQADAITKHDFLQDPIRTRVVAAGDDAEYPQAELLKAGGTTLGADNGIGVAAMMALIGGEAKSFAHGPIELLFTVDEETGMTGINNLSPSWLKGHYLLNLDTEEERYLMTSCAGAVDIEASFKYYMDKVVPEGDAAIRLTISGLAGGHSGMDIHLGRGNAIKLMCRFLKHAVVNFEARVASFNGGSLRNAIPREAEAVITVPAEVLDDVMEEVRYYDELYRFELRGIDEGVRLVAEEVQRPSALLPEEVQDDVLNCIEGVHDGVLRMSPDVPGIVETSSNLAAVSTVTGETSVVLLVRSMNEEMKRALASRVQSVFLLGGARVDFSAAYPGWELPAGSELLRLAREVHQSRFGRAIEVTATHCGLECGILAGLYPEMEVVSLGPTIHHPHSPNESVETASVEHFWEYLTALVEALR